MVFLAGADEDSSMQRPLISSSQVAGEDAPAIDLLHLSRYTLGNRALEAEVLALFVAQLPDTLLALRRARGESDWRIAAHTLKGSARAVGAWRLADLAEQAERSGLPAGAADPGLLAAIASAARETESFIVAHAAHRQPGR
jgi:HPt (histidine-containing phosphotransfer) domain-containing protein